MEKLGFLYKTERRLTALIASTVFLFTFLTIGICFSINKVAPFGDNSLASIDGNIQMLDLLSYEKDALEGKNSFVYSSSKSLGGGMIGVFGYYLSSPFNALLLLFPKTEMNTFYSIAIALKLALAAATFTFFIMKVFTKKRSRRSLTVFAIAGMCYALGNYGLAQSPLIMWLDGVYMLPLVLLGVHYAVTQKSRVLLPAAICLTILFNWYTGMMNCVFGIFWFFVEFGFWGKNLKSTAVRFMIMYALGFCMGMILLLPAIGSMMGGTRGGMNSLINLLNPSFAYSPLNLAQSYAIGASPGVRGFAEHWSLFCSSLALIGCASFCFSKVIPGKEKVLCVLMAVFTILIFCWTPFITLFSLGRNEAGGFCCRYAYIGFVPILYLAVKFFLIPLKEHCLPKKMIPVFATTFLSVFIVMNIAMPNKGFIIEGLCLTVVSFIASSAAIYLGWAWLAVVCVCTEMFIAANVQICQHLVENEVPSFKNYIVALEKRAEYLRQKDSSVYRISQTSSREHKSDKPISVYDDNAYLNYALAGNFMSLTSYTSVPDEKTNTFLNENGYIEYSKTMNPVATSVLSTDTFLGVKYIASRFRLDGVTAITEPDSEGFTIYENQNALPIAFTGNKDGDILQIQPLQNAAYDETTKAYSVSVPDGNYALYMRLDDASYSLIDVNHVYQLNSCTWMVPEWVQVPLDGKNTAEVVIEPQKYREDDDVQISFGIIDLDELQKNSDEIKKNNTAEILKFENGDLEFRAMGDSDHNRLTVTVPNSDGWQVIVNGNKITPDTIYDTFFSIPLDEGENFIQMEFTPKFVPANFVVFGIGLVGLCIFAKAGREK